MSVGVIGPLVKQLTGANAADRIATPSESTDPQSLTPLRLKD